MTSSWPWQYLGSGFAGVCAPAGAYPHGTQSLPRRFEVEAGDVVASINFAAGTHGDDCGHRRERTDRKLTRFMEWHAERPADAPVEEEPREAEVPDAYKARRYLMLACGFPTSAITNSR